MTVRKPLGESLGRKDDLSPQQIETFVDVASEAIKGQRPLAEIARIIQDHEAQQSENTKKNEPKEIFQKPLRKISESKKKMGRPARTGEKLRVVSLRLPESLDDAVTELAKEREARREWPWTKWEIIAEGARRFIAQQGEPAGQKKQKH
jgi:hypothetical protein